MLCIYYNICFTTAALLSGDECLQAMVTGAVQTMCFTGSQNAVSAHSLECWSSLCPVRWMPSHNINCWGNTGVLSAGEIKYLAPKSLWGTAGAQRDVELCSQCGSALAQHLAQSPLGTSCFAFSSNMSGLGEKSGSFFTAQSSCDFSAQKWWAPAAIPASKVECDRMEMPGVCQE